MTSLQDLIGQETHALLVGFTRDHLPIFRIPNIDGLLYGKLPDPYTEMKNFPCDNRRGKAFFRTYHQIEFFFETIGYFFDKNSPNKLKETPEEQRTFRVRLTDVMHGKDIGYCYLLSNL